MTQHNMFMTQFYCPYKIHYYNNNIFLVKKKANPTFRAEFRILQ